MVFQFNSENIQTLNSTKIAQKLLLSHFVEVFPTKIQKWYKSA